MKTITKHIWLSFIGISFLLPMNYANIAKQKTSRNSNFSGSKNISKNLLTNGGFENTKNLRAWNIDASYLSNKTPHKGSKQSVYINKNSKKHSIKQKINALAPGSYTFLGWFKYNHFTKNRGDWGYERFCVNPQGKDCSGKIAGKQKFFKNYTKNSWHKIAVSFEVQTQQNVEVVFEIFGPFAKVDLYLDDFVVIKKSAVNQLPHIHPTHKQKKNHAYNFFANGDDVDGAITSYRWDFGDGNYCVTSKNTCTHKYISSGKFTPQLTVVDNDGGITSKTLPSLTIKTSAPTIQIHSPTRSQIHQTSSNTISLSGIVHAKANIKKIVWDNINTKNANVISGTKNWRINNIALKPGKNEILITAMDEHGLVGTDKIFVERTINAPNIEGNVKGVLKGRNLGKYEKYEISFDVLTSAENPFWEYITTSSIPGVEPKKGVTIEAVFKANGKTWKVPAFYMMDVYKDGVWKEKTEAPHWKVRFTPREKGNYRLAINIKDKSGETLRSNLDHFTVLESNKKGFISVSSHDSRYFSYDNGDIFFPIGNGVNIVREWLGGIGAFSTRWSRWDSSGDKHGNEGKESPLTFHQHYPSSELSYKLIASETVDDAGPRITVGKTSENITSKLEPSQTYQIKLRLKTKGFKKKRGYKRNDWGLMLKYTNWKNNYNNLVALKHPSMIKPIQKDRDWHTVVAEFTTPNISKHSMKFINLFMKNMENTAEVYIDEMSIRKIHQDGTLGHEIVRSNRPDLHTYIEQVGAAYIDRRVQEGEAKGLYFKFVVQDKNDWWPNKLTKSGIFMNKGDSYYQLAGTKTAWLQKQWWRYLTARWGYSTHIHSWELLNEGSPTSPSHYKKANEFAKFFDDFDPYKHMATTSFWSNWVPRFWKNKNLYPHIDYADIHEYTPAGNKKGVNHINYSLANKWDMAEWNNQLSQKVYADKVNMPVMRAETGISPGNTSPDNRHLNLRHPNPGIWLHNLYWSQLNNGGMTDIAYWYAHTEHGKSVAKYLFDDRNKTQETINTIAKPFQKFVESLTIHEGGYIDINDALTNTNPKVRVYGQKNKTTAMGHFWAQNSQHKWPNDFKRRHAVKKREFKGYTFENIHAQNATITIDMGATNANKNFTVQYWDTYNRSDKSKNGVDIHDYKKNDYKGSLNNVIYKTKTLRANRLGHIKINIQNLRRDIAIKFFANTNNASGNNTRGSNAGRKNTAGNNTRGKNTSGNNTKGKNTGGNNGRGNSAGGNNTAGNNTKGNNTIPSNYSYNKHYNIEYSKKPWFQSDHDVNGSNFMDLHFKGKVGFKWQWNGGNDVSCKVFTYTRKFGSHTQTLNGKYCRPTGDPDKGWSFQVPTNSKPIVGNGNLYVGVYDYFHDINFQDKVHTYPEGNVVEKYYGGIYAIDEKTGKTKWRNKNIQSTVTPAFDDDTGYLYVGSVDGKLYKLDPNNGNVLQSFDVQLPINNAIRVVNENVYVLAGNDLHKDRLGDDGSKAGKENQGNGNCNASYNDYKGGCGKLFSINKFTMKKNWEYEFNSEPTTDVTISNKHKTIVFGVNDLHVYAVNMDGNLKWKVKPTPHTRTKQRKWDNTKNKYVYVHPKECANIHPKTAPYYGCPPTSKIYGEGGFYRLYNIHNYSNNSIVIAEKNGVAFVTFRTHIVSVVNGDFPSNKEYDTSDKVRKYLHAPRGVRKDKGRYSTLFALDIHNGNEKFVPAVLMAGTETMNYKLKTSSGLEYRTGEFISPIPTLTIPPAPILKNINGEEVLYLVTRNHKLNAVKKSGDSRWDALLAEMIIEPKGSYKAGDVRYIKTDKKYFYAPADEIYRLNMFGNRIIHNHQMAMEAFEITDRSSSKGSFSNPIIAIKKPYIMEDSERDCGIDNFTCTKPSNPYFDSRYYTPHDGVLFSMFPKRSFMEIGWDFQNDKPFVGYKIYSMGAKPKYTIGNSDSLYHMGVGGGIFGIQYKGAEIYPSNFSFGQVHKKAPINKKDFVIKNTSHKTITIDDIKIKNNNTNFTIYNASHCKKELHINEECTINISFEPTNKGANSAFVEIISNNVVLQHAYLAGYYSTD